MVGAVPSVAAQCGQRTSVPEHSSTLKKSIANAFEWVALFFRVFLSTGIAICSHEGRQKFLAKAVDNIDNEQDKSKQAKIIEILMRCINIFSKEDVATLSMQGKTDSCFKPIQEALSRKNATREQSRAGTLVPLDSTCPAESFVGLGSRMVPSSEESGRSDVELNEAGQGELARLVAAFENSISKKSSGSEHESAFSDESVITGYCRTPQAIALFNFVRDRAPEHAILKTAFDLLPNNENAVLIIFRRLVNMQVFFPEISCEQQINAMDEEYKNSGDLLQNVCKRGWENLFISLVDQQLSFYTQIKKPINIENLPWDFIIENKLERVFAKYIQQLPIPFLIDLQKNPKLQKWETGMKLINTELDFERLFKGFYYGDLSGDEDEFVQVIKVIDVEILQKVVLNNRRLFNLKEIYKFPEKIALALIKKMSAEYLFWKSSDIGNCHMQFDGCDNWEFANEASMTVREAIFSKLRQYLKLPANSSPEYVLDACHTKVTRAFERKHMTAIDYNLTGIFN